MDVCELDSQFLKTGWNLSLFFILYLIIHHIKEMKILQGSDPCATQQYVKQWKSHDMKFKV